MADTTKKASSGTKKSTVPKKPSPKKVSAATHTAKTVKENAPPSITVINKKETQAVVLDYLQWGYSEDKRPLNQREPIIIAIGTEQFKILELIAKKDKAVNLLDVVYIGDGERKVVERVKRRMSYAELTPAAKEELRRAVKEIVHINEPMFIHFFNTARYYTLTRSMLHLLPGFTTQKVVATMEARQVKPFDSFADIEQRVKGVKNPEKYICNRVLLELEKTDERHHLFTSK